MSAPPPPKPPELRSPPSQTRTPANETPASSDAELVEYLMRRNLSVETALKRLIVASSQLTAASGGSGYEADDVYLVWRPIFANAITHARAVVEPDYDPLQAGVSTTPERDSAEAT